MAAKEHDRPGLREASKHLEAFAAALKRDPELDSVLRQRGRALGVEAGSRLDRVVQAREIDRALTRSIDLEHGQRSRSGPSLGR